MSSANPLAACNSQAVSLKANTLGLLFSYSLLFQHHMHLLPLAVGVHETIGGFYGSQFLVLVFANIWRYVGVFQRALLWCSSLDTGAWVMECVAGGGIHASVLTASACAAGVALGMSLCFARSLSPIALEAGGAGKRKAE
jgi:hypothetical protein